MAVLTLIVFTVLRLIYLRKRKKSNETTETKTGKFLEIGQFLAAMIVVCCAIGLIPNVSVSQRYAQMQEKVNASQTEIAQLEESFLKEDITREKLEAFGTEYINLKSELKEAESYIKDNKNCAEHGLPIIKFLLYFGK